MDIGRIEIAEVYSPHRVPQVAEDYRLSTREALDLQTGWDLAKKEVRDMAWDKIKNERPRLIIGSPPCTEFSALHHMNEGRRAGDESTKRERQRAWHEAVEHVGFCVNIYRHQLRQRVHFLHEHPASAGSWQLPSVKELKEDRRVYEVKADMCMYGMTMRRRDGRQARAKKPTTFITSSWGIADELNMRCDGEQQHQQLVGGRAHDAAIYAKAHCKTIRRGLRKHIDAENADAVPAKKVGMKELNNIVSMSGIKKNTKAEFDGIRHHWRDEVHGKKEYIQ